MRHWLVNWQYELDGYVKPGAAGLLVNTHSWTVQQDDKVQITLFDLMAAMVVGGVAAWLWHMHGQRDHVLATMQGYCRRKSLILLDDYVLLCGLRPFAGGGRIGFERLYRFEFSVAGIDRRYTGRVAFMGKQLRRVELPPYPVVEETPPQGEVITTLVPLSV